MSDRKRFEVWAEGFRATGDESKATLLGVVTGADTFVQAIETVFGYSDNLDRKYLRLGDQPTYWGCRLFDNEADARKAFG